MRLAQLINFMSDASSPNALASGPSKTGGFIAYSSRSDPNLIKAFGGQPTAAQMGSRILSDGAAGVDSRFLLTWDKIANSVSGREVATFNIRVVNERDPWDGSRACTGATRVAESVIALMHTAIRKLIIRTFITRPS